jgi:hypothetical protein
MGVASTWDDLYGLFVKACRSFVPHLVHIYVYVCASTHKSLKICVSLHGFIHAFAYSESSFGHSFCVGVFILPRTMVAASFVSPMVAASFVSHLEVVYVCMRACACVCIHHVFVCVCMNACIFACACICTHMCIFICTYERFFTMWVYGVRDPPEKCAQKKSRESWLMLHGGRAG